MPRGLEGRKSKQKVRAFCGRACWCSGNRARWDCHSGAAVCDRESAPDYRWVWVRARLRGGWFLTHQPPSFLCFREVLSISCMVHSAHPSPWRAHAGEWFSPLAARLANSGPRGPSSGGPEPLVTCLELTRRPRPAAHATRRRYWVLPTCSHENASNKCTRLAHNANIVIAARVPSGFF